MTRNAVQTGLARLVRPAARLALPLLALLITPAFAGDRAGIDFIGYSPDNRYFAFEEFGVQDGSGFAYANLYVLDLALDQWVKGTPVRARIDDESSTIAAVRAEALGQARAVMDRLEIGAPVDILALNADGMLADDDQLLRFGKPSYGMDAPAQNYELRLTSVEAALNKPECADWSESEVAGFALSLSVDGQSREVYRDQSIPESRGCPQGYRLYGVIAPFDSFNSFAPDPLPGLLAIVSVYSLGFEGPDRRFIAVPISK